MVGFLGVMPVWLENEAPSTSSTSASFMNQEAIGVPDRPRTPQPSGWPPSATSPWSAISPLPLKVVSTGQPSCSARAVIAGMS